MVSGVHCTKSIIMASLLSTLLAGVTQAQLLATDIAALKQEGQVKGWTFKVAPNGATDRSLDQLCGLKEPADWKNRAKFEPSQPRLGLPVSFDWRTLGGCTPIKNQAACGSCWAFSTAGALECNILIKDGVITDLSEQWMVSCNPYGWGCNGGWYVNDMLLCQSVYGSVDPCGGHGAVLENEFPYQAMDVICTCPYSHPYCVTSWAFIGSGSGVASTDAIKQAIMDYGPVSVAVCADSAFQSYSGGVFNAFSGTSINHAVVLVGWDDTQGPNGVWFLRNSWGPYWGESGYMRIAYGCNSVGYAACYINYQRSDVLTVAPANGFVSHGETGGPFAPQCRSYTLTNNGTGPIDWNAAATAEWVSVSPNSSTLAVGESVTVSVCVNTNANALPFSVYHDTVTFSNVTSGNTRTRAVTLGVGQIDSFTEDFADANDNDLDNLTATFTPDHSASFYRACVQPATAFPLDPAGGTTLLLSDDSYAQVNLYNGAHVSLYGQQYGSFYVGSNGYITFGQGDSDLSESPQNHFRLPRISALFDDLIGGTVSWKQLSDRAVVTYQNTREFSSSTTNNFQIEMLFDGTIRVTWLAISASDGLAGLSSGQGLPADFQESDLSSHGPCDAPSLVSVASRMDHGASGTFDLPINQESGQVTCEGRGTSSNPLHLVFTFTKPVHPVDGVLDTEISFSGGLTPVLSTNGNHITAQITSVGSPSCLTITLSGLQDASGQSLEGTRQLHLGILWGDMDGDGMTNVYDLVKTRNVLNQPTTVDNFRADVNVDGRVDIYDLVQVRNNLNQAVVCP